MIHQNHLSIRLPYLLYSIFSQLKLEPIWWHWVKVMVHHRVRSSFIWQQTHGKLLTQSCNSVNRPDFRLWSETLKIEKAASEWLSKRQNWFRCNQSIGPIMMCNKNVQVRHFGFTVHKNLLRMWAILSGKTDLQRPLRSGYTHGWTWLPDYLKDLKYSLFKRQSTYLKKQSCFLVVCAQPNALKKAVHRILIRVINKP